MSLYDFVTKKESRKYQRVAAGVMGASVTAAGIVGMAAGAKVSIDTTKKMDDLKTQKTEYVRFINMVEDHERDLLDRYTSGEISYNEYKGLMTDVLMYRYVEMESGDNYTKDEIKEKISEIDEQLDGCKSDKLLFNAMAGTGAVLAICGGGLIDAAKRAEEVDEYLESEK